MLPENAEILGDIQLGNDDDNIEATIYFYHSSWDKKSTDKNNGVVHVLMDDCTPVFFAMEGKNPRGTDTILSYLIGNYKPKVDDPSVFEIPGICPKPKVRYDRSDPTMYPCRPNWPWAVACGN